MTNPTLHGQEPEALRFTKKPVTIEAIQWTGKNLREVIAFTDASPPSSRSTHAGMAWEAYADLVERDGLKISTLEGKMLANHGDWIIRGVKGEYYPCKPDIFEATYSPAALVEAQQPAPSAAAVQDEREAFEAWYIDQVRSKTSTTNDWSDDEIRGAWLSCPSGAYRSYFAGQSWEAWKARAARAPADSVLEDAARLDWLLLHISGAEFRRIGVHYSGNASRADVDAARKQGANHE